MMLSLFDLHCDTAGEMLNCGQGLNQNDLAVSLQKARGFRHYIQVMAHWTDHLLSDHEGWMRFHQILNNLKSDSAIINKQAQIVTTFSSPPPEKPTLILSVEDARILAGDISRVDVLYQYGIRILTPLWRGKTCIGGSHDTNIGLTEFGRLALTKAVKLGMLLDVSHASKASAEDICSIAREHNRPIIASHSNAYDICPVSRNLQRDQIRMIVSQNGLIGLNLYKAFLRSDREATAADALAHIDYFLSNGAEKHLALGCDMDGCELPPDIPDISTLPRLAELMLAHGYSQKLVEAIFYENAHRFFSKYLR